MADMIKNIENPKSAAGSDADVSMPRLNILRQAPTPEALQSITEDLAQKYKVVPLSVEIIH
jgi:hypothetical protein